MGHSEGDGGAWGAAGQEAQLPISGYLGTFTASPLTDITELSALYSSSLTSPPILTYYFANALRGVYPDFTPKLHSICPIFSLEQAYCG